MKRIELTQDKFALVDDEDYHELNQYMWCVVRGKSGIFYAHRAVKGGRELMHRRIMGAQPGQEIDHENRDGLDNQKSNMRFATRSQQALNTRIRDDNTSGIKGVNWCRVNRLWQARISKEGIRICLYTGKDFFEACCLRKAAEVGLCV